MRTNRLYTDYQPRRFNRKNHAVDMALRYDARAGRLPVMFDSYPEVLRLAWYEVRDGYSMLKRNAEAPKSRQREINDAIKVSEAKFSRIFNLWWNNEPITEEVGG